MSFYVIGHYRAMTTKHKTLAGRWIHIFTGGKQTDSEGNKHYFSKKQLQSIVDNEVGNPAPNVIGHPDSKAPSWAWTGGLKREGIKLYAKMTDVNSAFDKAVEKKTYPNRSISIGKKGDGFYLRHIGWLGGAAPAVDGLEAAFNAPADNEDILEFSEWSTASGFGAIARLMGGIRDWFIENESLETANQIIPAWNIDSIKAAEREARPTPKNRSFNKGSDDMPKEYTEAEIEQLKKDAAAEATTNARTEFAAEKDKLQKTLDDKNYSSALAKNQAFVDSLVKPADSKPAIISKAQAEGMAEFMTQLDTGEVSFEFSAEGDDESKEQKGSKWFKDFCSGLQATGLAFNKKQMDGDHSEGGEYVPSAQEISDFSAKHNCSATEASFKLVEAHESKAS